MALNERKVLVKCISQNILFVFTGNTNNVDFVVCWVLSIRLQSWDHIQSLQKYFYYDKGPRIEFKQIRFDPKIVSSGYVFRLQKQNSK